MTYKHLQTIFCVDKAPLTKPSKRPDSALNQLDLIVLFGLIFRFLLTMQFTVFRTFFQVLLVSLTATVSSPGQEMGQGSLEGNVVDAETRRPVIGAVISLEPLTKEYTLQQQRIGPTGAFRFTLVPGKGYYIQTEYYIRTEAAGYQPTKEKFIISSGYATHIANKIIYLKKGNLIATTPQQTSTVTQSLAGITPPPAQTTPAVPARASTASIPVTATAPSATIQTSKVTTTPPSVTARAGAAVPPATDRPTLALPVTAQAVQTQLKTVEFVQSKAELVPESQPALDRLLLFMRENPTTSIELAGHTDNQGNFEENLTLSKQRVELVKTFLVTNGIAADRISSRGYGSTRPVASNNSEKTRRLNRRVELIILTK